MDNAKGRVFKYGDNVDTDVIIPARYLNSSDPAELATHCMEDIDKDFTKKVIHECFDRGLIAESAGRKNAVLKLMPALITDDETLKKGLNIVKESVKAVLNK